MDDADVDAVNQSINWLEATAFDAECLPVATGEHGFRSAHWRRGTP